MRRALLIVAILITLAVGCELSPLIAQEVGGAYTVAGTNTDASTYTGRAEIAENDGVLHVQMYDDRSELTAVGIGLRDGSMFSLIFQTRDGGLGLALYHWDGKAWIGRWIVPGGQAVMTETLTPADPRLRGADQGPKRRL